MRMWTEDAIRQCLDGAFTKVLNDGTIITEAVDPNFVPVCAGGPKKGRGKNVNPHAFWTPAEDDLLHQMRLRDRPFAEIAWTLARTEEATKKRYKVLRVRGRVMV